MSDINLDNGEIKVFGDLFLIFEMLVVVV